MLQTRLTFDLTWLVLAVEESPAKMVAPVDLVLSASVAGSLGDGVDPFSTRVIMPILPDKMVGSLGFMVPAVPTGSLDEIINPTGSNVPTVPAVSSDEGLI